MNEYIMLSQSHQSHIMHEFLNNETRTFFKIKTVINARCFLILFPYFIHFRML